MMSAEGSSSTTEETQQQQSEIELAEQGKATRKNDNSAFSYDSADGESKDKEDDANDAANENRKRQNKKNFNTRKQFSKSFLAYDDSLLHKAVAEAGKWAYGTVLVELWAFTEEGSTVLVRPEAGTWYA